MSTVVRVLRHEKSPAVLGQVIFLTMRVTVVQPLILLECGWRVVDCMIRESQSGFLYVPVEPTPILCYPA